MLKNQITVEDGETILAMYKGGQGTATIARILKFKTHVVERFVRDSGIMRERRVAAAMGLRRIAAGNVGKTNKERMR